jgi:hypothetical protein
MIKLNLERVIGKLKRADDSVRSQAFDVLNKGYHSNKSDKEKSSEILQIITNVNSLDGYCLEDVINFLEFGNTILFPLKVDRRSEIIPEKKWGVHETHCCLEHGCKYGDRNCPVATGQIKQAYLCESCGYDEFENKCQEERYKK